MIEDFVSDVINKHIVRYNLLFGFVISSESFMPKLERISPLAGMV